jgi:CubicO group peptidase (beta-lactamase class C family)
VCSIPCTLLRDAVAPRSETPAEPGSKYHYSNSDNVAVALMVESATGKSYEQQLKEQVYGPLGLEETSLPRGV